MQISLKTKNRKLTPTEEDLIRKKVTRLPRYMDQLTEAEVLVGTEHTRRGVDTHVVQLTIHANGTLLRAEERDDEMLTAFDATIAKMERRIERYRGRRERNKKGRTHLGVAMAEPAAVAAQEEEDAADVIPRPIVRTKRFVVQPMAREDAVEQMELLGHNFFVFWDADTKHMAVLYRRQDGNYGLLDPELA